MVTAGMASASTIDGTNGVGDSYGTPLFIQDTATGFGDNGNADVLEADGSEINAVYGGISGGNLDLLVTGNLQTNFNRLVLFFDTGAGGDNVVGDSTTDTSMGGGTLDSYNGLTFDSSFTANAFLSINGGNSPVEFFVDYADIGGTGSFVGTTGGGNTTASFGNGIDVGIDNSNTGGVTGLSAAGAASVLTGFEFSIPLSLLGNPTGNIDVAGFISGGGSFLSNQVFGGVDGAGNLGDAPDFSSIAGDQFVTVVIPEPTALGGVLALSLVTLRRRRG